MEFRTKGQLAMDICARRYADGLVFDFACGDEDVLRVASNFVVTLVPGTKVTCAEAVRKLLTDKRRWEVRSRGEGFQGRAVVRLGLYRHRLSAPSTAGPSASEDRQTGLSLLLHPLGPADGQDTADQGGRAALAGMEDFRSGKDCLGLDQCQARTGHGRPANSAVTAAQLKDRTDTQPPPPITPDQAPLGPGVIPLTVPEIKRLLADAFIHLRTREHTMH